jgi:hypothetical protein
MQFPVNGALVALTSLGDDVWALVDSCPIGAVSCPQGMAKGTLYHAISARTLRWHRVGGPLPAGDGALFANDTHAVVVALGSFNFRRSVGTASQDLVSTGCESVGPLSNERLAGICGGGGGGNASVSTVALSDDHGSTWDQLAGGPPSDQYIGTLSTNGADTIFYVTGEQTLWRLSITGTTWQNVLQAPLGSTEGISLIYMAGTHGYSLVTNGLDGQWYETNDDGLTWVPVVLP